MHALPIAGRLHHAELSQIIDALPALAGRWTGRRITFEYALVRGVNDREETIDLLARKLRGMLCHVNLIPLNAVEGVAWRAPSRAQVLAFERVLAEAGYCCFLTVGGPENRAWLIRQGMTAPEAAA